MIYPWFGIIKHGLINHRMCHCIPLRTQSFSLSPVTSYGLGSYLLTSYGKPKICSDITKPVVCYCIKVTEENLAVASPSFSKYDTVCGARYYLRYVGLRQPGIFSTHYITNQPRWNITLRCTDRGVRFQVSLHQLNNDDMCRHSGTCKVARNSFVYQSSDTRILCCDLIRSDA